MQAASQKERDVTLVGRDDLYEDSIGYPMFTRLLVSLLESFAGAHNPSTRRRRAQPSRKDTA